MYEPAFRLIADRVIDLSSEGMLVAAEAEVGRCIRGRRLGDLEPAVALRFRYLERPS